MRSVSNAWPDSPRVVAPTLQVEGMARHNNRITFKTAVNIIDDAIKTNRLSSSKCEIDQHGLCSNKMALITSDCVAVGVRSTKPPALRSCRRAW